MGRDPNSERKNREGKKMTDLRNHARTTFIRELGCDVGTELEQSVFRWALTSCKALPLPSWDQEEVRRIYVAKYRMLGHNLLRPDCSLKQRLASREVHPSEACTMTHEELRPEMWLVKKGTEAEEEPAPRVRKSVLRCNNCARKGLPCFNTHYTQRQTRSADEPMTVFAFCYTCRQQWKC